MSRGLGEVLYLFSDVDGTLITDEGIIPDKNFEAIRRFTAEGGRFSLATGRVLVSTRALAASLGVNAPCILYNGALIYDYQTGRTLHQAFLPSSFRSDLAEIMHRFPFLRVMVALLEGNFEVGARVCQPHNPVYAKADELTKPWVKVLLVVPDRAQKRPVMQWITEILRPEGAAVTSSSDWFIEILPAGCSKGNGIRLFCGLMKAPADAVAVIGDYYNDWEMLREARHAACPMQAPDEIKKLCGDIVCPVEEGAVADYINRILKQRLPVGQ